MDIRTSDQERINVRTTAEMVPALKKRLDIGLLMAYEPRLYNCIPGKMPVSIRKYNVTRFDGKTVMRALQTRPCTISNRGMITSNPCYVHPGEWLAQSAPAGRQQT
jgi:hypothetical protein